MFTTRIGRLFTNFDGVTSPMGFHSGRTSALLVNAATTSVATTDLTWGISELYIKGVQTNTAGAATVAVSVWSKEGTPPIVIDNRTLTSDAEYHLSIPPGRRLVIETSSHSDMLITAILHEHDRAK